MKQVKLDEINESVGYLINNMSVTGQVLTLDSGQSLGGPTQDQKNSKMIEMRSCLHKINHKTD